MQLKSWHILIIGIIVHLFIAPGELFSLGGASLGSIVTTILTFHLYSLILAPYFYIPIILSLGIILCLLFFEKMRKVGALISIFFGITVLIFSIISGIRAYDFSSALYGDNSIVTILIYSLRSGVILGLSLLFAGIYYFRVLKLSNLSNNSSDISSQTEKVTELPYKDNYRKKTLIGVVFFGLIIIILIVGGYYFSNYLSIKNGKIEKKRKIINSESCISNCLVTFDKTIAYSDYESIDDAVKGMENVYIFDTSTGKKTIVNSKPATIGVVSGYDNKVVWTDDRKGENDWAMYLKDISTGTELELMATITNSVNAIKIFNNKIVFIQDDGTKRYKDFIYSYDLSTQTKTLLADEAASRSCVDIYDNNMVSTELSNSRYERKIDSSFGISYSDAAIYLYDLNKNTRKRIVEINSESENLTGCPSIYKDKIAYGKDNKFYLYDIDTANTTELVTDDFGRTTQLALHENKLKYVQTALYNGGFDNYSTTGECILFDIDSKEKEDITCNGGDVLSGWFSETD